MTMSQFIRVGHKCHLSVILHAVKRAMVQTINHDYTCLAAVMYKVHDYVIILNQSKYDATYVTFT